MNKPMAILVALLMVIVVFTLPSAMARDHGVADGSCDEFCEAENECNDLLDLITDEEQFYEAVANSDNYAVQSSCVFGVGFIR
ncbi:MAG: hypothetical protein AMJ53_05225 [Gammaproteobacteria bacterium SG8_11]|nr:MAG: hypothetical protein AMJ53_05225 [Gammaproteobacteria bacterium SG8_11]